jgi:hypothetical protein
MAAEKDMAMDTVAKDMRSQEQKSIRLISHIGLIDFVFKVLYLYPEE